MRVTTIATWPGAWVSVLLILASCQMSSRDISGYMPGTAMVAGDDNFVRPLPGLNASQSEQFQAGRKLFERTFTPSEGLGPLYNNTSCKACHGLPATGGGSPEILTLIGGKAIGAPITLKEDGGPIIADHAIFGIPIEQFPNGTTAISKRISPPTFGDGLIEAISSDDIQINLATSPRHREFGIRGKENFDDIDNGEIGRFGWKLQTGDMLSFTITAANFEMGLTSKQRPYEFFPNLIPQKLASPSWYLENRAATTSFVSKFFDVVGIGPGLAASPDMAPEYVNGWFARLQNPQPATPSPTAPFTAGWNAAAGKTISPDLTPDQITSLVAFQRFQAPPPPLPFTKQALFGQAAFSQVGCIECHVAQFTTAKNAIGIPVGMPVPLYSDLLLHDMGPLMDDGIRWQGTAEGADWRTTPLWGLRYRTRFIHDGRAGSLVEAIEAHGGEGALSVAAYNALDPTTRDALKAFLLSI